MAKLNEKYETMVVFSLKNGEEQVEALTDKFSILIQERATLVNTSVWGKRRLAYPINYENDGYYVLYSFDSAPDFPKELERVFNITEGVIRFLTVLRTEGSARPALERVLEVDEDEVEEVEETAENFDTAEESESSETSEQEE